MILMNEMLADVLICVGNVSLFPFASDNGCCLELLSQDPSYWAKHVSCEIQTQ